MSAFIHDDFLLQSDEARELYHRFAATEPIFDYHCHLPQKQIAENHAFADLSEIWLGGDHYKWRAMRSNGVQERLCMGTAHPARNTTLGAPPCRTRWAIPSTTGRISS